MALQPLSRHIRDQAGSGRRVAVQRHPVSLLFIPRMETTNSQLHASGTAAVVMTLVQF